MFDWNEDEEVRGTWGVLKETEDHIVPYPKGSKDDTFFTVDEYHKKWRHEQTNNNLGTTEERKSECENDSPGSNFKRDSNFRTNEALSAPRFDVDPWPDLPSINSAFGKSYMDRNYLHSNFISSGTASPDVDTVTENLVSGFSNANGVMQNRGLSVKESSGLPASGLIELDSESDIFVNDHGGEESGTFLNCDWANITDFDDLDRIFRNNDSIFGHKIISNADELLSPPTDAVSAITPSFSMPVDEQSEGEGKPVDKDKGDGGKGLLKSQKKLEKIRTKVSQNLSSWPSNTPSTRRFESMTMQAPLKYPLSSQPPAFCPETGRGPAHMGFFYSANQKLLPAYGNPTYAIPAVPMLSPAYPERKENDLDPSSHTVYPGSLKHPSVQSKSLVMTPQEKIEKLRRRQQMQAMFAIRKQQQQFGQQSTSTEMPVSQTNSQTNRSHCAAVNSRKVDGATKAMILSESNTPQEIDEPHKVSILIDDSLGEMIFYQLQDVIGKLDIGIRLCIRDSLFRLAKSSMERHNASDRNSTNKGSRDEDAFLANEETNIQDRSTLLLVETGTNPIDRNVAHLLFHRPAEPDTKTINDVSPLFSNPVSKWSKTGDSVLDDKSEDGDELEFKPSL